MNIKFSIITPVFNGEKYIKKCIETIASVQYDLVNVEHIIVDDGSTDSTKQICLDLTKKYKHLKVYSKSNGHWGSTINFVKINKLATGDYVLICDVDDVLRPKVFRSVVKKINKYHFKPDLIAGAFCLWNGKNQKIKIRSYYLAKNTLLKNWKNSFYSPLLLPFSAYIKSDVFYSLPDLKEKIPYQDNILFTNAFHKSQTIGTINKIFTWYWKKRDDNTMSKIMTEKGIKVQLGNLKYYSDQNWLSPFAFFLFGFPKIRKYLKQNNIKFYFSTKKFDTSGFPIFVRPILKLMYLTMVKKFIK